MDRFVSMQAFTRVVDVGSFARAAESLDLPKATLTRLIQNLETHLGVKLLHRTTRRISVTSDGAAYYERCVRILADVEEAEQSLTHQNQTPRGTLAVDTISGLAQLVLLPNLKGFFERYPDLKLELTINGKPIDLLKEGVDVVIRVGDTVDDTMVARRIGSLKLGLFASPLYLRRHGVPHTPEDLANHTAVNFLSNRTGREMPWLMHKDGNPLEILLPSALSTNDAEVYTGGAVEGLGIARMARVLAQPYLDSGRLVEVMPDWRADDLPISAMYPQNRHLSAKVRVFVDWAAEIFAEHPHMGEPRRLAA
ncbi:LysR family transcriptional regulator [Cupriavidus respiraculi]|uniref:HTH-type transcriptional regulator DmlR n=1 Tax=Cupriavidus respiraculi TaxID=195930 RepID=A0ABM8XGZ6_9BURK|nr:LysR family transcriptional regulator [Cupriavidus respiraculi]MBY4948598.1 LysR family transcriptional regulator [Cupriavidus respiraculi]CAG9179360.1 HTH-type transcriptional regulator DmlR [Cupriavidus respiraculi]